ncbi:hypothetical protein SAMN02799624_06628 [Paenibacillus sp. UNC496MF]|uniref:hypothetical protein n=1 Tax=Paenibacillus sp. UNC496MF TaxID=1502753 RepID=UPI0008E3D0D7|nr:hypothetical protein [Paenibacillus sp. UNC496MF]SFJ92848.1 hypothetical protein SAMN02799624_06628 [Paenibacillus sp. UNC496MF]
MIAVTVVFGCVAYYEWRYLRKLNRSKRAFRIVLGLLALLWVIVVTVEQLRPRFSIGIAFAGLFDPLQRLLYLK